MTIGTDVYAGISLWSLLGGTSGIATSGGGNNPIMRNYVTATASNGSQSLISVGEIHPNFGGVGDPFVVAYAINGNPLPAPRLINTEDPAGVRTVANLASLNVASMPRPTGSGGLSTQFTLSGVGITPGTFNLTTLQTPSSQVPAKTVLHDVTFLSGMNTTGPFDYTGVRLWDMLTLAGINNDLTLQGYLLATGSDGYQAFFSLAELDPAKHGTDVLIAYHSSLFSAVSPGAPGGLGDAGFARLVVPGDFRGGRYVSNLVSLEVGYIQAVPEAHTWALMLAGLVLVGLISRRRAIHA